jgi:hypothetical protein
MPLTSLSFMIGLLEGVEGVAIFGPPWGAASRGAMYTSIALSAASPPTVPAASPALIAGLLGIGALLPTAGHSLRLAEGGGAWVAAWAAVFGLGLLATMRRRLPSVQHPAAGVLWQLAGIFGAAVLLRHASGALGLSAAEAPWSMGPVAGLDLADWAVLGGLVLLCVPAGIFHVLRAKRPGLLVPSAVGISLMMAPLVAAGPRLDRLTWTVDDPWMQALPAACALAWTAALVGPAALPLRARRTMTDRVAPRLMLGLVHVGGPILLIAASGLQRLQLAGPAVLGPSGRAAWGGNGLRVAAGLEVAVCLLAALVVVVLCARVSAHWMPQLRSGAVPAMALAAGLAAGWISGANLLVLAGFAGWIAILVGLEAAPWVAAGQEDLDAP